ncbi:MAG: hypothetical protein PWP67_2924 [Clostridium butyricum]|jgi:hypothetical protein|nr:hypothetical protein [Clostridium butyricum]
MLKWGDELNNKKTNKAEKHKEICERLNQIYQAKNRDYGNSFGEMYKKLGIISAITRMGDKYNRLVNLCTKSESERQVKDETIKDTLMDLANYAIMTIIELEDKE